MNSYFCSYCGIDDDLLSTLQGTKYLENLTQLYPRFNSHSLFCEICMKKIIVKLKELNSIIENESTTVTNSSNERVTTSTSNPTSTSNITTSFTDILQVIKSEYGDENNSLEINNNSSEVVIDKRKPVKVVPTFIEVPVSRRPAPKSIKERRKHLMIQQKRLELRHCYKSHTPAKPVSSETSLEVQQIHSKNYVPREDIVTPNSTTETETSSTTQRSTKRRKYNLDKDNNPIQPLFPVFKYKRQRGG